MMEYQSSLSPTKEPSEHLRVRYTGDWSSDSKLSSVTSGYWEDPFLSIFNKVEPVPRRTSLICRGYYVRFRVCNFFLRSILEAAEEPFQIVSLGCGMDTTYFRMLPQFESKISRFFEIDFDSVIQAKKEIIANNEILKLMQDEKLQLVSADLRSTSNLRDALSSCNFDFTSPTIFYSECVVNYLRPRESEEILKWIVNNVPRSVWLAYEQCYSNDSFGRIMTKHFERNGCPLLSLPRNPDMESQKLQLQKVGFQTYYIFNAWDAFVHLTKDEQRPFPVTSNRLQFDEYEALLATCLHYSVRVGSCGDIGAISQFFSSAEGEIVKSQPVFSTSCTILTPDENHDLDSFLVTKKLAMHSSVSCSGNEFLVFGGVQENSHRSLSLDKIAFPPSAEVSEFDRVFKSECVREDKELFERLHSAVAYHPRTRSFYVFGGRKSPRNACDNSLVQVSCCRDTYVVKSLDFLKSPSPGARWRHAMVATAQDLVMFGGKNEKEVFGDVWRFEFVKGLWVQDSPETCPSPRHSHSMCYDVSDKIYCIGGLEKNETHFCKDSVWMCEAGQWVSIPELSMYGQRIGHCTAIHDSTLFIVGGYGASSAYNLDHFVTLVNICTNSVKVCCLHLCPDKLFLPYAFSLVLVKESEEKQNLVVYGGGGNCFSFGTHYNEYAFVIPLGEATSNVFVD